MMTPQKEQILTNKVSENKSLNRHKHNLRGSNCKFKKALVIISKIDVLQHIF